MEEARHALMPDTQVFRDIFDASPIGIAVENLEGRPLFVNRAFCSMLGFTEEELRTKHCVDFSPPEDVEKDWALFQQLRAGSIDHYQLEKRYFRRDGSLVWGSLSISLLKSSPSPLVLAMVEDITDKKKAEETRFRYAAVIESSDDAIASGTLDGIIVSWNTGAQKIYGYTEAEAVGKPISMLVPPELPDEENKILETLKAGGRIEHFETVRVSKTGKRINVSLSLSPIKDSRGRTVGVSGIARDITERKRAEEALRASEERLRLAQQAARIGTFEWNIQTGVNTWTPELEEMYGLPRGGFGGTQTAFENLVYSDDRAGVTELNNWALKTGLPTQGEWRVVWPDGSVHWIAGRWQVFMNDSGEPSRMVGINIDITDRKRVEQELSEANERLRLALEAGSAGGWDYDLKAGKNVWFGTAHEQLGMTPDETSGSRKEFWDRIHEDDRERVEHALQVAKEKHEVYAEDVRVVWRDGTTRWLRSRGRFQYDANGEAERSLGISLDITENKQAEQALRASEERLRLAQQAARIGTFERDVRTGRITWAEGLEPLYGLSPGSLDGKTPEFFKDLIHPNDRQRVAQLIQQALKTGQPTEGEWRAIWPDDSVHWIASRWQVLMDDSGAPSRVVGVNMDVTERKLAELALHAHEELLKIFVKNVPAAVAMLDRDMHYLQVSDRWCTDYLSGADQILGRSHYELFPDMPERWKEAHRCALAGETLRADEDHWEAQDGPHWARWEVRPWKTPEGIVGGILILAEDITRRKQMEEMLSRMSRKLIEAQEQERARIGRELHDDINQRVAILAIEIERLERRPRVPSEIRKTAHEISGRIKELCTDIQALSQELHSSKLEYRGIVGGMKSWCREFGERHGMQIEFKSSGSFSSLPSQTSVCLFRILQEALHNSAKHSGVKNVDVQLREEPGEVQLIVHDQGKGFDVAAAMQGRGLGVISMLERVRLLGGTVTIDSKPQGGTTVYACIPLEAHQAQQAGL